MKLLRFFSLPVLQSHCIALLMALLFVLPANAQYKLRLLVKNNDSLHKTDPVFIAGNFNNWNPANSSYQLKTEVPHLSIEFLNLPAGTYQFKFTRGSWAKASCSKSGQDLENYSLALSSDTTVYYNIDAWKDDFSATEKKHTASANVKIVDTAFYMPQLNRSRRISIYLPPGYEASAKRYPVLYMHDGQNLFDDYFAGYGEWGVDECLDSLIKKGKKACIVVGIDNSEKRMNEYNPFYFEQFGKGEGEAYVKFIAETLKPFIDSSYRTLTDRANTIIAGSSMGGLISFYAMLRHPAVFGKAGVFSPAFWTAPEIDNTTDSLAHNLNGMLFFYMGKLEGDHYMEDMLRICDKLGKSSATYIYTAVDEKGSHNEKAWQKWFAEFYEWIMADGNNYIIKTSD